MRLAALAAFADRDNGVCIADIVEDAGPPRHLRFARPNTPEEGIEVDVLVDGRRRMLLSITFRAHPATPLTVRHASGEIDVRTDDAGRVTVAGVSHGLTSVLLTPLAGESVRTAWVVL